MKIACYYFPGLDPDMVEKPFESIRPAINWGKWNCEQHGTSEFSILYGRKYYTYKVCEGEWARNGNQNKSKNALKSPTILNEPKNKKKVKKV